MLAILTQPLTLAAGMADCPIIFSGKRWSSQTGKPNPLKGFIQVIEGVRIPAGEYLYLIDIYGRSVLAPKVYLSQSSSAERVQTHLELEQASGLSHFVAAGEVYFNPQSEIVLLNNRSGSFLPGIENLNVALKVFKKTQKISPELQLEDYSSISKAHPLYVENPYLDVLHTISAVGLIGREAFVLSLSESNPISSISKKMIAAQKRKVANEKNLLDRRAVIRPEVQDSRSLQLELTQTLNPMRNWEKMKSQNREWGTPRTWNQFYHQYQLQRNLGQFYWDLHEFSEIYSKNIQISDEINASYTLNEIETQVTWNERIYLVPTFHVSLDLTGGLTHSFTPLHDEVLSKWAALLGWPEKLNKIYDHTRGGIFVRKFRDDPVVRFYQTSQLSFRAQGPNWDRPDVEIDLRSF